MLQKFIQSIFRPELRKFENKVGYKLVFKNIPDRFINGLVEVDLTNTLRKFGLNIEEAADYFTMGHIVNGISSRFDRNTPEYQSWLGGYIVKLPSKQSWSVEDHFKLAIADQNSWLHTYGDPNPMTTIEGWKFNAIGPINADKYSGTLYEGGCTTHNDVGNGHSSVKFRIETDLLADLFNFANPKLIIKGNMLRPKTTDYPYETLKLRGYIAIFHIEETVKVVLYGNGAIVDGADTFDVLKADLLEAMRSCEITKV